MPKKQPRNSFYFFMLDFKEEQRKKGIAYANMNEVAQAAGPAWTSAAPALRAKYEALAKAEKAKTNVPERKFTSTGVSLADLDAAEREKKEAIEAERRDIINFVKQKSINESILDEDIFLMDVNCYCKAGGAWLVGEMALLRFSLRDGVKDTYHEVINPGGIPIGYALDVKIGAKELGLSMPDEGTRRADYIHILANTVEYLKQLGAAGAGAGGATGAARGGAGGALASALPALYTLPDKVQQCQHFIQQLCSKAAEDDGIFRVYQLDTLFYQLVTHIPSRSDEGFPKESLALAQLKKDPFKYSPGLACEMHEEVDKSVECTLSRVKRWAFTVLDTTGALLGIEPAPGRHAPADYNLAAIITYKEERRAMDGRGAAHLSPDDTPIEHPSMDTTPDELDASRGSAAGSAAGGAGRRRVHVPLRLPSADYSMSVRAAPALSSSHEHFPPLGKGRGRGLAANFGQLKME